CRCRGVLECRVLKYLHHVGQNGVPGEQRPRVEVLSALRTDINPEVVFAKEHIDWPKEKWCDILWTDESKIVLIGRKGH
uniref:Uncharacterized protein n=1 Tax=Pundamilia nyererei TaxID=303518 RepID=A0A3B4GHR8_9CICH